MNLRLCRVPEMTTDAAGVPVDGGGSSSSGMFDNKIIQKPGKLLSKDLWDEWKFDMENFLTLVEAEYFEELRLASEEDVYVNDEGTSQLRRRSVLLYAMLASLTTGKAKLIIKGLRNRRNGFEGWRLLCEEYEPKSDSRRLALVNEIMEAKVLKGKSNSQFAAALMTWEDLIDNYEKLGGTLFDAEIKRALLLANAPEQIAIHLQVNPQASDTYQHMREAIESYLQRRGEWTTGDGDNDAMDIGAISYGDKGCNKCGKTHGPKACPFFKHKCSKCGKTGHAETHCRNTGGGGRPPSGGGHDNKQSCLRCGGKSHAKEQCPAFKSNCNKCGKTGHFASVCKSKTAGSERGNRAPPSDKPGGKVQCYCCGGDHQARACPRRWNKPMDVGAIDDNRSVGSAETIPIGPQRRNADGTIGAVIVQTLPEIYEQDWILAVEGDSASESEAEDYDEVEIESVSEWLAVGAEVHEICAVGSNQHRLLVDSGATATVFKKNEFKAPVDPKSDLRLNSIKGDALTVYGKQAPKLRLSSGRQAETSGTVADVSKSVLAVAPSLDNGISTCFTTLGSYMTKTPPPIPADAEWITREKNSFYLPCEEIEDNLIAPVDEEATPEGDEQDRDEMDQAFEDSIVAKEIRPFGRCERVDMQASQFRLARPADGCNWKDVFRRVTKEIDTDTILADEIVSELPEDYEWQKRIPGGKKNIVTRFYFFLGNDGSSVADLLRKSRERRLKAPSEPSDLMRRQHEDNLHCPFAPWCDACVAGRSRGTAHTATERTDSVSKFEFDYTYFSQAGYEVSKESRERAACVLTGVHRQSATLMATVVLRKGVWPFAVAVCAAFVKSCRVKEAELRGDPEHALRDLLEAVCAKLRESGIPSKADAGARDSHQSIGAVEKGHDILSGFARTLAYVVHKHIGVWILPRSRLFAWLIKLAAYAVSTKHVRKNGQTSHFMLHGAEARTPLAQFGEQMMGRPGGQMHLSKALPRWRKGVWVGVNPQDGCHILLDNTGFFVCREVNRVVPSQQWSKDAMETCAGLPWSRHEGATQRFAPVLAQSNFHGLPEAPKEKKSEESSSSGLVRAPQTPAGMETHVAPETEPLASQVPAHSVPQQRGPLACQVPAHSVPQQRGPLACQVQRGEKRGGGESLIDPRLEPEQPSTPRVGISNTPTGSPGQVAQSRAASWEPEFEGSAKRWRPTGRSAAILIDAIAMIEHEVVDTDVQEYVRSAEDFAKPAMSAATRLELRNDEIQKLSDFKTFKPIPADQVPPGQRVYDYTWVDTELKSRITCKDLRRFKTTETVAERSSPTPSQASCALFEYFTVAHELVMVVFDAMSAFLHAPEKSDMVFMKAPDEWCDMVGIPKGSTVWEMLKSLYGRRTAGANFRDLFEAIMISVPGMDFVRGNAEPCFYFSDKAKTGIIHHVDDGKVSGTMQTTNAVVAWSSKYLLLKVSPPIQAGMSFKFLGRVKVRTEMGFNTFPDKKLVGNIHTALGYDEQDKAKIKTCPTPGVKRLKEINGDVEESTGRNVTAFRSGVGSGLFLAADIEILAFPVKELSRRMQKPDAEAWAGLARIGRFMIDKVDFGIENKCEELNPCKHTLLGKVDAATMSDENGRATTGFRVLINGYKISHYAGTQPGLPALSSGEAELRAKTRAGCELLYLQAVALELGMETDVWMETDATASLQNASKLSGGRMKHIGHMDAFIKQIVKTKQIKLRHKPGIDNSADLLTKHVTAEVLMRLGPETGFQKLAAPIEPAKLTAINAVQDLEAPEELVKAHEEKTKADVNSTASGLAPSRGITVTEAMTLISAVISSAEAAADGECEQCSGWHWIWLWVVLIIGVILGRQFYFIETKLKQPTTSPVGTQSQCTYTRWTETPRFKLLGSHGE